MPNTLASADRKLPTRRTPACAGSFIGRRLTGLLRAAWLACVTALTLAAATAVAVPVPVLTVHDAIGPASADYIVRGIERAAQAGAPLVVIELDTPGGLDTSMRQIIQAMLASRVPVAVYVSPQGSRAASAGTYILYAAHIAAMAPATTLGAATPVAIGMPGIGRDRTPGGPDGGPAPTSTPGGASAASAPVPRSTPTAPADAMTAKQVNDAAAFIRGLAQQRGRNAEWAERAVREAVTLTASEALRDQVIDIVAQDLPDLLAEADGHRVQLQGREHTLATRGLATERWPPDWR